MLYAALALVGLALAVFVLVALVVGISWVFKPKPKPVGAPSQSQTIEDRNVDLFRLMFPPPSPTSAPLPDLEDINLGYLRKRKAEEERNDVRRKLDEQLGVAAVPKS